MVGAAGFEPTTPSPPEPRKILNASDRFRRNTPYRVPGFLASFGKLVSSVGHQSIPVIEWTNGRNALRFQKVEANITIGCCGPKRTLPLGRFAAAFNKNITISEAR